MGKRERIVAPIGTGAGHMFSRPAGPPAAAMIPANMGALTSLRALLAWWVVAFHAAPLAPFRLDQNGAFLGKGPVLVDGFFVLSGFVLFHMHSRILCPPLRRHAMLEFLVARFARLYPVHLAMLTAFVLLIGTLRLAIGFHPADAQNFSLRALIDQLLLLNGIVGADHRSWNFPSWSISSEWAAYMLAPPLFYGIVTARSWLLLLAGIGVGCLVIAGMETDQLAWLHAPLARVTLEFALGALLRRLAGALTDALCRIRVLALGLGWSATLLLAGSHHPGLFFAALIWTMLFLSLNGGWTGRLGAVGRYLGESSYCVYMCHALILMIWGGLLSRLPLDRPGLAIPAAILLCLSIQGSACLLHHLVERPARHAVREWGRRGLAAWPVSGRYRENGFASPLQTVGEPGRG